MGSRAIVGLISTPAQAETILALLGRAGIPSSDVSVLLSDRKGTRYIAQEQGMKPRDGASPGAGAGGVLGGTSGPMAGVGALAIAGLGPLMAAGPIMATLSGAAAGATVAGIARALVSMGIPEPEAKQYEAKVQHGDVLISVHSRDAEEARAVKKLLEEAGAREVSTSSEESVRKSGRRVAVA